MTQTTPAFCRLCGEDYPAGRAALGYHTCLDCGDAHASAERAAWTIAPIAHKQGETLVTDRRQLRQTNKYSHDT